MHFGSPSLLAGASDVEPTYTAQVLVVVVCDTVAVKPSAVTAMVGPTTPLVTLYAVPRLLVYFTESANFGIAIAAKMPMITTTIRSSISVKPLRFIWTNLPCKDLRQQQRFYSTPARGTNRASIGQTQRKLHRVNELAHGVGVPRPPKKRCKLRLFASRHAGRKNGCNS